MINNGPCVSELGDIRASLDITPRPVLAMRELAFRILLEGASELPPQLVLDLSMPGMFMGENRITLAHSGGGVYEGQGVIPRCPSGKRLWAARLQLPGLEDAVKYRFEVLR